MEERSFSSSEEAVPLSHVTLGLDLSLPLQSMIGAHSKQLPPSKNSTSGWWFVPLLLTPMGLPVVGCDKVTKGKYWWALRASLAFRVVPQETTPLVPLTHLTPLETSLYLLTRCMSLVWESVCVGGVWKQKHFPLERYSPRQLLSSEWEIQLHSQQVRGVLPGPHYVLPATASF